MDFPTPGMDYSALDNDPLCQVVRWATPEGLGVVLHGAEVRVGRSEKAPVRPEGQLVSREHAEFVRQGPDYVVHDLASRNGTFVNGMPAEYSPVKPGDVIRFGDAVGVLAEEPESATELAFRELAPGLFGGACLAGALADLRSVAQHPIPVLVIGETGTGKELIARAVHEFSGRTGPLRAINCGAIPESIAEGELFGHRKGAFTGARDGALGHLRAASGGTLFLDEIASLPLPLQVKLLRVIQEREVVPLGDTEPVPVDLKLVAASQRPLQDLVKAGLFRDDLCARLTGTVVELPPLRQRRADVASLFFKFFELETKGGRPNVSPRFLESLCLYDWPKNVRELLLLTQGLVARHGSKIEFSRSLLPAHIQGPDFESVCRQTAEPTRDRKDHDLEHLAKALQETNGNLTAAASALNISRQRIYRLLGGRSPQEFLAEQARLGGRSPASAKR